MRGKPMHNKQKWALKGVFFLLIGGVILAVAGGGVMLLWNAILPRVIGVQPLGYWDALGLLVLCRILFGSFHKGGPAGPKHRRKHWREKWNNMSEEERALLKARWKQRCKPDPQE